MDDTIRTDDAWRLLEAVSVLDPGDDQAVADACGLIRPGLDVDRLVALAKNHHLLPALGEFLVREDRIGMLPAAMANHLIHSWQWNRHRSRLLVAEADRVREALTAQDVPVAFTKGVVVQSTLYGGRGIRYFGDIDLMIRPADQERVREVLLGLGFPWAKRFDIRTERLVDRSRRRLALYRLNPDHLPHFSRLTGDGALPVLTVDVAFHLSWFRSRWQVPIEQALAETPAVPVGQDVRLPTLTWPYTFLFMVFHLFREAWYAQSAAEYDVRLTQFADLVRLWRTAAAADIAAIRALITKYDLGDAMCWVGHHTDALFGTEIVAGLGLESHAGQEWLCSAGGPDHRPLGWAGDMRSRLAGTAPPRFEPAGS